MDDDDRNKIEKIIRDRKRAHTVLDRECSKVHHAFQDLEQAAFTEGRLSKKQKELIALGISIVINCESCMEWHAGQSLAHGASREEIMETIGVAIEMGGGPATVAARFALKALEYHANRSYNPDG